MSEKKKPSNLRILFFFFGFVFLFFLVFSLGVIVGKGLGNKNKNNIITQQYEQEDSAEDFKKDEMKIESDDFTMKSDESEKIDNVIEDTEDLSTEKVEEKVAPKKSVEVSKPKEVKKPKVVEKTSKPQKTVKKEAPKKVASSTAGTFPEVDKDGKYTIQIGSFKDKTSAQKAMNLYQAKGYPAFIQEYSIDDKETWYRLRIGTFNEKGNAKIYADSLRAKEDKIETFITVNN